MTPKSKQCATHQIQMEWDEGIGYWCKECDRQRREWEEHQLSRGDLAFEPETIYCVFCKAEHEVVKVIKPRKTDFDPTYTYTLDCGHTVI